MPGAVAKSNSVDTNQIKSDSNNTFEIENMKMDSNETIVDTAEVLSNLKKQASFFKSIIHLIPAKHYVSSETLVAAGLLDEDHALKSTRFYHNKKNKAPKQDIKENTKLAKKVKFTPSSTINSVEAIQSAAADNSNGSQVNDTQADAMSILKNIPTTPMPLPASITELQGRLHEKISQLRSRRAVKEDSKEGDDLDNEETKNDSDKKTDEPSALPIPRSRQEILERRALRKKERKDKITKQRDMLRTGSAASSLTNTKNTKEEDSKKKQDTASEYITSDGIQFNKIIEPKKVNDPTAILDGKRKKRSMDIASKIQKLESKKRKIDSLDGETQKQIKLNQAWSKAEKLAVGEKVKDDVALLKKSLKRKQQQKKKSAEKWAERISAQKKQK